PRATRPLCRRSPAGCSRRIRKWACAEVKSALGVARPSACSRKRRQRGLFRRLEQRRYPGAQLIEQCRLVRFGGLEVARLDMAEAADFFRDRGEPHGDGVGVAIKTRQYLLEHRLVVAHERALDLALGRIAERIEGGPAQEFEFRDQTEQRENPRPERHLLRLTGDLVAAGEKRRCKMHEETQVLAAEFALDLLGE